ncbi:hypothetical protein GCM10022221_43490 [Actinocorallia aurea]
MSSETIQSVEQMLDSRPVTDVTVTFERYQALLLELKAKIDARFETTRDPSTLELESYGTYPEGPGGRVSAYSGPEIDWMVHSWLGNPAASFANLHLTVWLGPHIRVPHLGIALLVWPEGWFYVDSVPRVSLVIDGEYYDKYYAPVNEPWLKFKDDNPEFTWFTSPAAFIRTSLSPTANCYSFPLSEDNLQAVEKWAREHVDRWLAWVDEAEEVPEDERAALRETDLTIRRNIAERDPANSMGVRFFGEELTEKLVRALWGGDRELPRP